VKVWIITSVRGADFLIATDAFPSKSFSLYNSPYSPQGFPVSVGSVVIERAESMPGSSPRDGLSLSLNPVAFSTTALDLGRTCEAALIPLTDIGVVGGDCCVVPWVNSCVIRFAGIPDKFARRGKLRQTGICTVRY